MKERPILFSAPMVRAILEGRKTQTRRVAKPQPVELRGAAKGGVIHEPCRYGQPGDRLWVRETFAHWMARELFSGRPWPTTAFRAGRQWRRAPEGAPSSVPIEQWDLIWNDDYKPVDVPWRPSIHMPRATSRITLEITEVRLERLQAISEADAIAEGVNPAAGLVGDDDLAVRDVIQAHDFRAGTFHGMPTPIARFALLWDSINGKKPGVTNWNANPWVWAVSFRPVELGQ